jgi:hypothetical protein
MPRLFDRIIELQGQFPLFNQFPLSSEQVLTWAWDTGVYPIDSTRVPYARTFMHKGKKVLTFNPHLPETMLTLSIAHDLGHNLLGHVGESNILNLSDIFSKNRMERDATVIALLCLIPTKHLLYLYSSERLYPEELHYDFRHLWDGMDAGFCLKLCKERIRVFSVFMLACNGNCLKGVHCLKGKRGLKDMNFKE